MAATGVHSDDPVSLRNWVLGWAVVALALRLLPLALPIDWSAPDSLSYLDPARSVLAGQGYSATHRPPGYPAFIIIVLGASGGWVPALQLAQALLGALTVPLVAGILRRHGPLPTRLGAALVALDPVAIGQTPFVLREALLLTLLTALIYVLSRLRGRLRHVTAGALLAALALIHPLYLLLGPALTVADAWPAPTWAARLRRVVPWVAVGLIVALPTFLWGRRNQEHSGRFGLGEIPTTVPARELWLTSACSNAWLSGDTATGFQALAWRREAELVAAHGVDGAKAELYRLAAANWRQHPVRSLGRVLRQNLWYWLEIPGAVRLVHHDRLFVARWAILPWHWVRLTCALAGLVWLLRTGRWRGDRATLGALAFFLLAPAMLYPIPRYLAPATPLLDALAALGLAEAWSRRRAAP